VIKINFLRAYCSDSARIDKLCDGSPTFNRSHVQKEKTNESRTALTSKELGKLTCGKKKKLVSDKVKENVPSKKSRSPLLLHSRRSCQHECASAARNMP
jgi:hypothetical protein